MILIVTERFRCQCLASGQDRIFGFFGLTEWSSLMFFEFCKGCVVRLDVGIIKLCNRLINITENIVLLVSLCGGIIKIDF